MPSMIALREPRSNCGDDRNDWPRLQNCAEQPFPLIGCQHEDIKRPSAMRPHRAPPERVTRSCSPCADHCFDLRPHGAVADQRTLLGMADRRARRRGIKSSEISAVSNTRQFPREELFGPTPAARRRSRLPCSIRQMASDQCRTDH